MRVYFAVFLLAITVCAAPVLGQTSAPPLDRCINLGNMLEAANEGDWGLRVQDYFLSDIAEAGFQTVRIPIKWSAHAEDDAPYAIDPTFMSRIETVVGWALAQDLQVIINVHHYDEMATDPANHEERLIALWTQIAEYFADYPSTLVFELLNEPNSALTPERWNALIPRLIDAVRPSNPDRWLVIGGGNWNGYWSLPELELPEDDHIVATFHYYDPFEVTHQGAEWVNGSGAWLGRMWGTRADYRALEEAFATAQAWADEQGVALFLGEFGMYHAADWTSRMLYTQAVRETAEMNGFGWCYWELAAGFGIYDANTRQYNDLLSALIVR